VYLQNTCIGASGSCTSVAWQLTTGVTKANSSNRPRFSADGRFVAYVTFNAVISGQTLANPTVFLHDACTGAPSGCAPQTIPACLASDGAIADAACSLDGISSDGKYILISSPATNLSPLPGGVANPSYVVTNPLN